MPNKSQYIHVVILRVLILCLAVVAFSGCVQQPKDVYLLIGQSNMSGRAHLIEGDDAVIPGVYLLNEQGMWEPARQPLNRYASDRKDLEMQRFNPGGPFAKSMRETDPDKTIGLIVNARGGTKIESWQPGQALYENALNRVKTLGDVHLVGVLWHQGEGNSMDEQYAEKLTNVIQGIRRDLNQPDLPFIAGHISGENIINDQMDALAGKLPNMGAVSVDGLERFDGGHYDHDGVIILGKRYAEAYQQVVGKRKQ